MRFLKTSTSASIGQVQHNGSRQLPAAYLYPSSRTSAYDHVHTHSHHHSLESPHHHQIQWVIEKYQETILDCPGYLNVYGISYDTQCVTSRQQHKTKRKNCLFLTWDLGFMNILLCQPLPPVPELWQLSRKQGCIIDLISHLCRVVMSVVSQTKLSDETCSSAHIATISECIVNWKELALQFGLTPAEEEEIQMSDCNYKIQKSNMLWKWVRKQGDKATYHELKRVFEEAGEALLVCKLK